MGVPSAAPQEDHMHPAIVVGLTALALTTATLVTGFQGAFASPDRAGNAASAVRFATFNASLNRDAEGALAAELAVPGSAQPAAVAEIIQNARPEVLLINEFDYDPAALDLFRENYLEVSQNGADPIHYEYTFIAPSNTGVPSGYDLDNNGVVGGPNDAFGFGF